MNKIRKNLKPGCILKMRRDSKIEGIGRLLNHQKLSLFLVLFLTLIPVLSSCNHKELHYEANSQFRLLKVAFDWSQLSGHEKPEGMRVIFFPKDGKSEPWIFDFPKGEARQIELPENDYGVISMNYDTNGIVWENPNSYLNFTADTRDTKSPDGEQASLTPSWLCGDHINWVSVNASHAAASSESSENGVQVITLYPKSMVCRYTYEVNGIRKLERIADIRASLSGMSGSLLMAADKLPDSLSERLLFGGDVIGNQLRGGFYTFGSTQGIAAPNLFKLFIKSRSGKLYVLEQDVTAQIQSVPVVGHVGDVHLVINLDFEIPEEGGGGSSGGSSSGGAGFDVGVDDWGDVNEDIIC